MSNRKEILILKYSELLSNMTSVGFSSSLFPSLDDVDVVDLLLLFNVWFAQTVDYEPKIRELINFQGLKVEEEEFQRGLPIIIDYIYWLKAFQKQ